MTGRWGCKFSKARKLLLLASGWLPATMSVLYAQTYETVNAVGAAMPTETYTPSLSFDVASIRQSPVAESYVVSSSFVPNSSHFRATNVQAVNLIVQAFDIRFDQILRMPIWSTTFNIEAKSDNAADERLAKLTSDRVELEQRHMLQTLLTDRFKLKAHWETRKGPSYDLVVNKKGLKMKETKGEPPTAEEQKIWGDKPVPTLYQRGSSGLGFDFIAHGCSMSDITSMLAGQFARPVTDRTGLTGRYNFTLRYHKARLSDRDADDMDPIPTLDVAIQDQLGLKLKPATSPIQFLVIDHIEKPSAN